MKYLSYTFAIKSNSLNIETVSEILIAELGYVGFQSFTENENEVMAYIQKKGWYEEILSEVQILKSDEFEISYQYEEIKEINWNSEWEKNFESIQVDNLVSVRAPFHDKLDLKYDIIIEPKMSFGTGHHETTHMMIQQLLELDIKDKRVLDMGCGTGILAIFSEMKGAIDIDAIDIDEWCYQNTIENIEKNNCQNIKTFHGDASLLGAKKYDLIIANINRNILLNDIEHYTSNLNQQGGILLLSGFYENDIPIIDKKAKNNKLILQKTLSRNNWVSLKYVN